MLSPSSPFDVPYQRKGPSADPQQDLFRLCLPQTSFWSVWNMQRRHPGSRKAAVAAQQGCLIKGVSVWPTHHCCPSLGNIIHLCAPQAQVLLLRPETWSSPPHFSWYPSGQACRPPAVRPHRDGTQPLHIESLLPQTRSLPQQTPWLQWCLIDSPCSLWTSTLIRLFPYISRYGWMLFSHEEHLLFGPDSLQVPVVPALLSSSVQWVLKFPLSVSYPLPHPKALSNSPKYCPLQSPPSLPYSSSSPIAPHWNVITLPQVSPVGCSVETILPKSHCKVFMCLRSR